MNKVADTASASVDVETNSTDHSHTSGIRMEKDSSFLKIGKTTMKIQQRLGPEEMKAIVGLSWVTAWLIVPDVGYCWEGS